MFTGKAKIERPGKHITVVCAGKATDTALQAANELAGTGNSNFYLYYKYFIE